jgi:folate-dependent tRNA-U54 methylase TrmFO/GidA
MNANFGLVDPLADAPKDKALKRERIAERALADLAGWMREAGVAETVAAG